jgi:hypothetical protein
MSRVFILMLLSTLPLLSVEVMWKGTGAVTAGHTGFGVKAGDKVDVTIRYALKDKVQKANLQPNTQYIKRVIYHGAIRLRIEVRVGTKEWIAYTETTEHPLPNLLWSPFEVLSTNPAVTPGAGISGDMITFRAYSVAGAKFEKFHYPFGHSVRAIALVVGDFAHPYTMLTLEQYPDKTLNAAAITNFTGTIFADDTVNGFNFAINSASVTVSDYFPPIQLKITKVAGGGHNLSFTTEAGGWYELKGSDNLIHWVSLGIHPGINDGVRTIPAPPGGSKRFYRIDRLPGPP